MIDFTCAAEDCTKAARTRGLCPAHYQAARRAGALAPVDPQSTRPCEIADCASNAFQRGLCHKHYRRLRLYGDPTVVKREYHIGGRPCTHQGCEQTARARGLCQPHYMRRYRGQEMDVTPKPRRGSVCTVDGCGEAHHALGYCATHHARVKRTGEPGDLAKQRQSNAGQMCTGPECEQPAHSRGLCPGHYFQQSVGRELTPIIRAAGVPKGTPCAVDGCERPSLTKDGICRTHAEYRRAGLVNWQQPIPKRAPHGTGHVDEHGYRLISVRGKQRREHVVFAERMLGRSLYEHENVHHLNGNRSDNRTDGPFVMTDEGKLRSGNLEVWSTFQPAGQEVGPKLDWAVEILREYLDVMDPRRLAVLAGLGDGAREMLAVYGDKAEQAWFTEYAPAVLADATAAGAADDDGGGVRRSSLG